MNNFSITIQKNSVALHALRVEARALLSCGSCAHAQYAGENPARQGARLLAQSTREGAAAGVAWRQKKRLLIR